MKQRIFQGDDDMEVQLKTFYDDGEINLKDYRYLTGLNEKVEKNKNILAQFESVVPNGKDAKLDANIEKLKLNMLNSEDPKAVFQSTLNMAQLLRTERNKELLKESQFFVDDIDKAKSQIRKLHSDGRLDLDTALRELRKLNGV